MQHRALRAYVRSMDYYDIAGFPAGDHVGLPSATVTLVIPAGQPLDLSMPSQPRRLMGSCIAGLDDRPATIHHDGSQRGLFLALTPLGLHRLFGIPASALAHEAADLAEVLGERAANQLLDSIAGAPSWAARLRVLETDLVQRLAASDDSHHAVRPEVAHAWSLLSSSRGTARIHDVAAEVGWSTRHLTTQFAAAVGPAPKTVARIMRFQRSKSLVAKGHDLAGVAARCRYADQAHMTREWARLAGTTPTRWERDDVLANVQDTRRGRAENR